MSDHRKALSTAELVFPLVFLWDLALHRKIEQNKNKQTKKNKKQKQKIKIKFKRFLAFKKE